MTYLLTLVTVTKNCINSIERTLKSVEEIKKSNIEYIVVDGLSDDGTIDIIHKYKRIIDCFVTEKDSGIYNAMNKAARLARGSHILFINGDDQLIKDSFDTVVDYLTNYSPDILSMTTEYFNGNGSSKKIIARPWHLLFYNSIPHPSTIVKTSLILKYPFREDLRIASDYDLFLKLYLNFISFSIIDVSLSTHYSGGISSNVVLSEKEIKLVRNDNLGSYVVFLDFLAHSRKCLRIAFQKVMGVSI